MKTKIKLLSTLLLCMLFSCEIRLEPYREAVDEDATMIQPGEYLPEFSTVTLSGKNVSKKDLLGKASLVIFFSTTCPDCHKQLPEVEAAWRRMKEEANFLAIARDEPAATVKSFWEQAGLTFDVAAPGKRDIYDLFDRNSKSGVPQVYLSAPDGMVLSTADDSAVMGYEKIVKVLSGIELQL